MKRFFCFVLSVFLIMPLLSSCSKVQKSTIKVGLEENLLPYCYYNDKGEADGFYVKAIEEIAEKSGFSDVEIYPCSFGELEEKLERKEIDCFASKNKNGKENLLKSESFFYTGAAFLINPKSRFSDAATIDEILNANVCTLKNGNEKRNFKFLNLTELDSVQQIENAISNEGADAFSGDYLIARALRATANEELLFKIFPDTDLAGEDNCHYLYFRGNDIQLCSKLNSAIECFTLKDSQDIAENQMKIISEIKFKKTVEK